MCVTCAYFGPSLVPALVAATKRKGDLAELKVAADLVARGFKIAFPYGEDSDFDLILCRDGALERVQVKHACSDGHILEVRCESASLTNGRVMKRKRYTEEQKIERETEAGD